MLGMIRGICLYRHFIISSIVNELIARFANNKWSGLWMIINPLSQVLIYAIILSNVLAAKLPGIEAKHAYAIYLMASLLGWNLFSEIVARCLTLFIDQGNLMKKMSFPRIALPCIVIGSCLINNFLLFISMLVVFLALGHSFTIVMLFLIPLTLLTVVLALGIGLTLGVLNVFVRDVGQGFSVILQMWFWLTPIVYPIAIIPESYRHLLALNPMYPVISAYQQILVYGKMPMLDDMAMPFVLSLAVLAFSLIIFRRANAEMVDVL